MILPNVVLHFWEIFSCAKLFYSKKKKNKKKSEAKLELPWKKEGKKKKTTHKTLQERKKMFMSIVTVQPSTVTG